MKNFAFLFFLTLVLQFNFQASKAQRPEWAGVWGIWGGEKYSRTQYPWLKGTMVAVNWSQIQPEPDRFDFSALDKKITEAANNGLYIIYKVYVSPNPPAWLNTELGVEFFRTSATYSWVTDPVYPWYYDPVFEQQFKKMISAVADHVDTYPPQIREKIIALQTPVGKSGDPQAYDGTPEVPKFLITLKDTAWRDYNRRMFSYFYEVYKNKQPEIKLVVKPIENNEEWALQNLPGTGRKTNMTAQGYHLAREMNGIRQLEGFINNSNGGFMRGEFDRAVNDNTLWYQVSPLWNVYWTGLWCLTHQLDIWNIRTQIMDNPESFIPSFEFYSKWAGYKKPETSPGAWIAFRDDLDCADTIRFPQSIYGKYEAPNQTTVPNHARFNAIAAAFAPYGAHQDDPETVKLQALNVVKEQKGFNDVQWDVWRGNYGMFLKQIAPNETSQGYWRVGSKSEPYGRFARGFNQSENKNAIYLDIDDQMFNTKPGEKAGEVIVSVIYFDGGNGKWELRYDAVANNNKLAVEVTNTHSGTWKNVTITINDASFANRGVNNSDISIVNADNKDNIFHRVEITRKQTISAKSTDQTYNKQVMVYPNPFNPATQKTAIHLPEEPNVDTVVAIYNNTGTTVRKIHCNAINLSSQKIIFWDGRDENNEPARAGLYFGSVSGKNQSYSFKIIIV